MSAQCANCSAHLSRVLPHGGEAVGKPVAEFGHKAPERYVFRRLCNGGHRSRVLLVREKVG